MKVKLKNGNIADMRLRDAQRYIRLGLASVYELPPSLSEPAIFNKPEVEEKPTKKKRKKVEDSLSKGSMDTTKNWKDFRDSEFDKSD